MTASQASPRVGVAVMSYWRGSLPTSVCDRECMSGSVWIGTLHIRPEHSSCPFVVTSVSESPNSFDYICEGRIMNRKYLAQLLLAGCVFVVPSLEAQIRHIEMRVEGMT